MHPPRYKSRGDKRRDFQKNWEKKAKKKGFLGALRTGGTGEWEAPCNGRRRREVMGAGAGEAGDEARQERPKAATRRASWRRSRAKADAEPRTTESVARPGGPVERYVVAVGAKFFSEKGVLGMSESESRGPEVASSDREKWGKKAEK